MKRALSNTRYHNCRNFHSNQNQKSGNQSSLKTCCFCGKRFTLEHKEKCAARNVNCNLCGKKGHFTKCCNSAKPQVDNVISDEEDEKMTNLTDSDSEPDNSVLRVKEVIKDAASCLCWREWLANSFKNNRATSKT